MVALNAIAASTKGTAEDLLETTGMSLLVLDGRLLGLD